MFQEWLKRKAALAYQSGGRETEKGGRILIYIIRRPKKLEWRRKRSSQGQTNGMKGSDISGE